LTENTLPAERLQQWAKSTIARIKDLMIFSIMLIDI
jgi:hypothetical protein